MCSAALGANTSATPAQGTRIARDTDAGGAPTRRRATRRGAIEVRARARAHRPLRCRAIAVGGLLRDRARNAREPLIAWAYTELLRDEARHGAFGAQAGDWVIRHWTPAQRQTLWADCLREMQTFEHRIGGPV